MRRRQAHNIMHGVCKMDKNIYQIWYGMIRRCEDTAWCRYNSWGGRGITVCDEWHDVTKFYEWTKNNGYEKGLQLDRIDNNKGYSPQNCRFITDKENSRNCRRTIKLNINGITKSLSEWSEITGVNNNTIHTWIKRNGIEFAENKIENFIIN